MSTSNGESPKHIRARKWRPVDWVAMTLALGLTGSIALILIVTGIQVALGGSFPKVELSENATQILISGIGGMTGLLGAYIGLNRRSKSNDNNSTQE